MKNKTKAILMMLPLILLLCFLFGGVIFTFIKTIDQWYIWTIPFVIGGIVYLFVKGSEKYE